MIIEKNIGNKNTNQIDVFFSDAAFTLLYKSELINNDLYSFVDDFTTNDIKNINIEINIDKSKDIRIWTSKNNIHEYLSFLYFCYKLPNNIKVIFTNEYDSYCHTLGSADYKEIKELLKYEHNHTKEEKENYKNEWLKLTKENSNLRVFKKNKVISVDYNYFNDYISKYYNKNITHTKLIAILMGNDNENNINYYIWETLIEKFERK